MVVFKDLWNGHPINESVEFPCIAPRDMKNIEDKLILAGTPMYPNQCAIRLSIALKRAGAKPIPGLATCGAHPPEEMHYVNAQQVANALARSGVVEGLAPVQKLIGNDAHQFYPHLFGRTGIVFFQNYWQRTNDRPGEPTGDHIDVWNGYRSSAKWLMEWFSWLGYYSNYAHASEIWFWEVK